MASWQTRGAGVALSVTVAGGRKHTGTDGRARRDARRM